MINDCIWDWAGTIWDLLTNNCPLGETCPYPGTPGTQIGQQCSTVCGSVG